MSLLVVVGDTLLDEDVDGACSRLAPDAPVPVVSDPVTTRRAGGAGLAARLAALDGDEVLLVTALADDEDAARIRAELAGRVHLLELPLGGTTPVKTRVHAAGRPLVRLDRGRPDAVGEPRPGALAAIRSADAVLVADYGQGVTAQPGLRAALADAAARHAVVWDPHPRGTSPVPGCVVTPNEGEARQLAPPVSAEPGSLREAQELARALRAQWSARAVVLTRGARGALLDYGDGAPLVVPARELGRVDPCGAGDRFASRLAGSLARGSVLSSALADAVTASGEFLAGGGVATLDAATSPAPQGESAADVVARTRAAGGTVVATGGCFDLLHVGHVATLAAARRLGDCLVVLVNSDASVRRLKGPQRPLVGERERAAVLQALASVDAVAVFDEDTPVAALERLRPDVWVKGGDYGGQVLPEQAALERWGGQVVALPYLEGHSTTALVDAIAAPTGGDRR